MLDRFDQTIKRDYLKYNPIGEEGQNRSDQSKTYKKPDKHELERDFDKLRFALKSQLISRRRLTEEKAVVGKEVKDENN